MNSDLQNLLRRSSAARAALGLFRAMFRARLGGLTVPAICYVLRARHPRSTIQHACLELHRLGAISWTGAWIKTRHYGRSKVWRPREPKDNRTLISANHR